MGVKVDLLKIEGLAVEYDGHYIFDNFNLSLQAGERIVIIGESGSGKTSIIRAILADANYRGTIKSNSKISYMPQGLGLLEHKTVKDNVELPSKLDPNIQKPGDVDYTHFGLDQLKNRYVSKLSGGQRQRVALMRALFTGGDIMLFDEPLSKLDAITKGKMLDYFISNIPVNAGLIYITHDLEEAIKIGTKIIVMSEDPQVIDNNIDKHKLYEILKNLVNRRSDNEDTFD